jgi:hypothetical protein
MAILLFSLRGVPEDEAYEVRELLHTQQIDFYETSAGNWGVSMPALWLRNDQQLMQAQQLLYDYQQQRQISQRQLYLQRKQAGQHKTLATLFKEKPFVISSYFLAMLLTIYVSIKWLFEFGFAIF